MIVAIVIVSSVIGYLLGLIVGWHIGREHRKKLIRRCAWCKTLTDTCGHKVTDGVCPDCYARAAGRVEDQAEPLRREAKEFWV